MAWVGLRSISSLFRTGRCGSGTRSCGSTLRIVLLLALGLDEPQTDDGGNEPEDGAEEGEDLGCAEPAS